MSGAGDDDGAASGVARGAEPAAPDVAQDAESEAPDGAHDTEGAAPGVAQDAEGAVPGAEDAAQDAEDAAQDAEVAAQDAEDAAVCDRVFVTTARASLGACFKTEWQRLGKKAEPAFRALVTILREAMAAAGLLMQADLERVCAGACGAQAMGARRAGGGAVWHDPWRRAFAH